MRIPVDRYLVYGDDLFLLKQTPAFSRVLGANRREQNSW